MDIAVNVLLVFYFMIVFLNLEPIPKIDRNIARLFLIISDNV